jgi:hypothetical protein
MPPDSPFAPTTASIPPENPNLDLTLSTPPNLPVNFHPLVCILLPLNSTRPSANPTSSLLRTPSSFFCVQHRFTLRNSLSFIPMCSFPSATHIPFGMLPRAHPFMSSNAYCTIKGPACAELCIWSPPSWHPAWRQNCCPRSQLVGSSSPSLRDENYQLTAWFTSHKSPMIAGDILPNPCIGWRKAY